MFKITFCICEKIPVKIFFRQGKAEKFSILSILYLQSTVLTAKFFLPNSAPQAKKGDF